MLFILEQYLRDRRAKVRQWENDKETWLNDPKYENHYRSESGWIHSNPYPVFKWKKLLNGAFPIFLILFVCVGIFIISSDFGSNADDKKKQGTSQAERKKTDYRVGDKVQVVYGSFKDSVGELVKVSDNGGIVKLTTSTMTKEMCNADSSCSDGGGLDVGQLLDVDSFKNLVPFKETK